jgi:hypothetical protein
VLSKWNFHVDATRGCKSRLAMQCSVTVVTSDSLFHCHGVASFGSSMGRNYPLLLPTCVLTVFLGMHGNLEHSVIKILCCFRLLLRITVIFITCGAVKHKISSSTALKWKVKKSKEL